MRHRCPPACRGGGEERGSMSWAPAGRELARTTGAHLHTKDETWGWKRELMGVGPGSGAATSQGHNSGKV